MPVSSKSLRGGISTMEEMEKYLGKRKVEFIQNQTSKSWEEVSQAQSHGHILQTIRLLSRPMEVIQKI